MHRRQFLIGPEPATDLAGWRSVELAHDQILSHCASLPVATARDAGDVVWHLIGTAVQTDPERPDPLADVARTRTEHVPALHASWAGRWVLVGNGQIHPDASGLLGCYVHAGTSGTWISSSTSLLAEKTGAVPDDRGTRLRSGKMNWYPPPATKYRTISKLLPSQTLTIASGVICPRPWLPERTPDVAYESLLDALQARLIHGIRRAAEGYGAVWVPLSAGYDSRLVLSLALYAGLPVKTYTWRKVNDWWNAGAREPRTSYTLKSDMTLPPRIARAAGVEHRWIEKQPFDRSALAAYDAHSDGNTLENDRAYFAHGQWSWSRPSDLILRGGVFEVGHCFYQKIFEAPAPDGTVPDADQIASMFKLDPGSVHVDGLAAWVETIRSQPEERVDWRERLYVEQRVAGWLSSLEQALDLVPGERFYPVNASELFAILLSLPEEKRWTLEHHTDLIERMTPELLEIPINPPEPFLRRRSIRALQRAARIVAKVRAMVS